MLVPDSFLSVGRVLAWLCLVSGVAIGPSAAYADLTGAAGAPTYTSQGVVHAATQLAQTLAPNAIATIYGTNLAYSTVSVGAADLANGTMPTSLAQVTVYVNNIPASLFYVSPSQINFLIPYTITASAATIYVVRQGVAGPTVTVALAATAPGLFVWNGNIALATHADGSLIAPPSPAHGGEIVVLYAGGLGRTSPDQTNGELATRAAPILALSTFQVLVNGAALPAANVLYAGAAPGFAGLYQINVQLPGSPGSNPTVQISTGTAVSVAGVMLPVQ